MKLKDKASLQQQLGMWLGLPENAREPKTQEELAKQLGLTQETLSKWKRLPEVQEMAKNSLKLMAMGSNLEIWNKTIEMAKTGNVNAQRLYFQITEQLKKKENKTSPMRFTVEYVTDD